MALEIDIWPLPKEARDGAGGRPVPSIIPYWDFLVPKVPGGKFVVEESGTGRTTIDPAVVFGQPVPDDVLSSIGWLPPFSDGGVSGGGSGGGASWGWLAALALLGVGAWLVLR